MKLKPGYVYYTSPSVRFLRDADFKPTAPCRNCGHAFLDHWKAKAEKWEPGLGVCCYSCPGYDEGDR